MKEVPRSGPGEPDPPHTVPDLSPEARRRAALRGQLDRHVGPGSKVHRVFTRVWTGAWNDGFIHAGNLAYVTIVALFPFFITVAAIFSAIGEQQQREASIASFLVALPQVVAKALQPVAQDVVEARKGWLLWLGGLVGLWTVGSLIETIRDVLRRAYGTRPTHAFWRYRLFSTGLIIVAVILLLFSLLAQVALGAAQQAIHARYPGADHLVNEIALGRLAPAVILFASLYLVFYTLTPSTYRKRRYPKWPGALFVTAWWVGVSVVLPVLLRSLFNYDATYGSLAGVMIALFFFWLVGLGLVIGAELNAALAESPEERNALGQGDDRERTRKDKEAGDDR